VLGAIVQKKVEKISEAKGHGKPNEEGAHGEGEEDEEEDIVVARSGVAIFHAYIVACRVAEVKRNQPKIVWAMRATTESASTAQKK
jgi:hypothetical protein